MLATPSFLVCLLTLVHLSIAFSSFEPVLNVYDQKKHKGFEMPLRKRNEPKKVQPALKKLFYNYILSKKNVGPTESSDGQEIIDDWFNTAFKFLDRMKLKNILKDENNSQVNSKIYWPYSKYGVASPFAPNGGTSSPTKGIKLDSSSKTDNSKDHGEPLYDFMGTQYYVTVQLGTPNQDLHVVLDTGSSDLWVPSSSCPVTRCYLHPRYDSSKSSSYSPDGSPFSIQYGSGSVNGFASFDEVGIAGLAVPDVKFGEATNMSTSFAFFVADGIFGLGLKKIAKIGLPPLYVIKEKKLLEKNIVTFYFGTHDSKKPNKGSSAKHFGELEGMVTFGAEDLDNCNGPFVYHSVLDESWFMVGVNWAKIGNKNLIGGDDSKEGYVAVIDTGTSLIAMDTSISKAINEAIGAEPAQNGVYSIDCSTIDSLPLFSLNIGGVTYTLDARVYVTKIFQNCISSFVGIDLPPRMKKMLIVGDVFLRKYCSAYDYDNLAVGLAPAKV